MNGAADRLDRRCRGAMYTATRKPRRKCARHPRASLASPTGPVTHKISEEATVAPRADQEAISQASDAYVLAPPVMRVLPETGMTSSLPRQKPHRDPFYGQLFECRTSRTRSSATWSSR